MISIRDMILLFLYNNKDSDTVNLSDYFATHDDLNLTEARYVLRTMENSKLMTLKGNWSSLGITSQGSKQNFSNLRITGRILDAGVIIAQQLQLTWTASRKMIEILKHLSKVHSGLPSQSSVTSRELQEKLFKGLVTLREVEYLCRTLISNGDVMDVSSKDGLEICYSGATDDAIFSDKYLKEIPQPVNPLVAPEPVELYNIYINAGGKKQSKHAVSLVEVEKVVAAINSGLDQVFVSGRALTLMPLDLIQIYDFSKNWMELKSVGYVKDEMSRMKGIWHEKGPTLFARFGVDVTSRFKFSLEYPVVPVGNFVNGDLFPLEIFNNTRGYLIKTATQASLCYRYGLYDACFVLVRKLTETLIIEAFERHGIASKIKGNDGHYFFLSDLINAFTNESTWTIGRISRSNLPKLKKLADSSAHNRRFHAQKNDFDPTVDLRMVIEEVIHLIDYPSWNGNP